MPRRSLAALSLFSFTLAASACAPTWWIRGAAMAETDTKITPACIADALRASGVEKPEPFPMVAGGVGYSVKSAGEGALVLHWDERHPREISISSSGTGDLVDPVAIERERAARATLLAELTKACGPFEAKVVETCDHADCATSAE